jgi:hypothetical protein
MTQRGHLHSLAAGAFASSLSLAKISARVFPLCLIMASAALAQSPPDGDFFDYAATLLDGAVSAEVQLPPADCRRLCVERRGCVGYDYFHTTDMCRMFSSVTSAREDRHGVAATRSLVQTYHPPLNLPAQASVPQQAPVRPPPKSRVTATPHRVSPKRSGFAGGLIGRDPDLPNYCIYREAGRYGRRYTTHCPRR